MADISRPNFARRRKLRWWRHQPRQPRRHRAAARIDWQLWRLIFTVGGLMLGALALWINESDISRGPDSGIIASHIDVIGDTVRSGGHVYRLVGYTYPSPETMPAACASATWRQTQRGGFGNWWRTARPSLNMCVALASQGPRDPTPATMDAAAAG
ncbi:MAG TPA: hypothetical protein VFR71_08740 [Methyloceanibacter sp.]|nr:hypothetical protein [Methyloceanibacter sp.]